MIDVLIEYPYMHFKRKTIGKVPSSWEELTERQFIAISRVIDGADPDYRFLSIMTGISREVLKKLSPYELLKLSEGIDFIGKSGGFYADFIIRELPWKSFVAPKPKLAGISFGQFIFLDAYYRDWTTAADETALNKFVASLYLLPAEKFDNEICIERLEEIAGVDLDIRKAIAFNFTLVQVWLQKAYPLIFPDTRDEAESAEVPKQSNSSGWINIFESMVGEDLINRDKYSEQPIHTLHRYMTRKFKENPRK